MDKQLSTIVYERAREFQRLFDDKAKHDVMENIISGIKPYLESCGFFTAPASTKYHGAYEGGLYDHSKAVFLRLQNLTDKLNIKWQRAESPFIIGMLHDLCKCDQYKKVEGRKMIIDEKEFTVMDGFHYEYNTETILKGHGAKSVMMIAPYLSLTEEEVLCIRYHMGPYEKDEWTEYDLAIKKYEGVLWTHTADMLASKVDGI